MAPPPSSLETTVSQQSPEVISTVHLADEDTPIANLASHGRDNLRIGKRRMVATREARKENVTGAAKSVVSTSSGERLLKNVKQEK